MALNPVDQDFLERLDAGLPAGSLRAPEPRYLREPRRHWRGKAGVVAAPRCTDEVATVVRACAEARVGIVPYGGGTGLVGGQIMPEGPAPLLLSLERMNAIRDIRPEENLLVAEAGVILADLHTAAGGVDRKFPLSMASQGSAQVGGILSCNAGGVHVLRHGSARGLCLGLEAVLPDGAVWHGLSRLRKDNTGYDLRGLLIGAEGTLGVICAATLALVSVPSATATAILATPSPQSALDFLALARRRAWDAVDAFELINRLGYEFIAEVAPEVRLPFTGFPMWSVLVELQMSCGQDPNRVMEELFEAGVRAGMVTDGVIAGSGAQRDSLWSVREMIPVANQRIGAVVSHDISLPLSEVPRFIERVPERVRAVGAFRANCYGHLGDGNLHYNFFAPAGHAPSVDIDQRKALERAVHDLVHEMGGSISAEHGIGRLKVRDLERYSDPAGLEAMRAIKAALDPLGFMNPGAVLRR